MSSFHHGQEPEDDHTTHGMSIIATQEDGMNFQDHESIISSQSHILPFSEVGLVGRSHERQTLQGVVNAISPISSATIQSEEPAAASAANPKHAMALISGPSGSGKSALAMDFQHQCLDRHAFFVSGKFDLKQMEEPYSGIKAALTDLCQQMLALQGFDDSSSSADSASLTEPDLRHFSDLQASLSTGLAATEIHALSKVIPDILKVMDLTPLEEEARKQRSPSMTSNLSGSATASHADTTNRMGYREQSERLKFVLRRFMQISCQFCPVIMVIDDLQWADKASMDLLQSWMLMDHGSSTASTSTNSTISTNSTTGHSLLIIGCFRSGAGEQHSQILQDAIEDLKSVQDSRSIGIVELNLGDMKVSQVHELVCGLLLSSPNKTSSGDSSTANSTGNSIVSSQSTGNYESLALARIVHKRTGGNAFFVKHFMQQLCHDGLIYYDRNEHRWTWKSEAEIVEKSTATTNIVNLMKDKMEHIQAARQILPIAACLGATFSKANLTMVIRSLSIHSGHATFFRKIFDIPRHLNDAWVDGVLQSCEREGLIESHQKRSNKLAAKNKKKNKKARNTSKQDHINLHSFIHDKVQEASLSLIPADCVTELQYRVGDALSSCLAPTELDDNIFMVASLLNLRHDLVPSTDRSDRRMKIAMLNRMAGEKAVSCGVFQSALSYFETAISLLPDDHWKSQSEASLNLYSSAAECSFVTSDMAQVHKYTTGVINQNCSMMGKIRAYHILIDAGTAEAENNKDADPLGLCLFVLSELGYKFPQSKIPQTFATIRGMLKMKRCVPKWTLQEFDDMQVCTDAKDLAITKTLSKLSTIAYKSKPDIVPLVIVKLVERTLNCGISQYSLPSFCLLGFIVGFFMGDFHSARKLAQISLRMLERVNCPATKCGTIFMANAMCLHWTSPIEDGKIPYLESYRIGMADGDIESATWSIFHHIKVHMFTGTPLPTLEDDLSRYSKLMRDFHQTTQYHSCDIIRQMVQNLRGKSANRTLLVGEAYDAEAELKRLEAEPDAHRSLLIQAMNMSAAVQFGDFAVGAKIACETYGSRLKHHAGVVGLPPSIFDSGLCSYAACAKKMKTKYKKTAKKCRAKLRDWQEKGNPNCDHLVSILDAEHCALKGKHEAATKHYAIAITLTRSRGYIQYEALAHERLADHLLKEDLDGKTKATHHMSKAIDLSEQWGATSKVANLRGKYDEFLPQLQHNPSPGY